MKRNLYVMYAIALLQGMVFYGPIATLYREAAGVSIFQITLIEGISLALGIALEVPWGIVADRMGHRRTMIVCCGLYLVSKVVFWQASGFGGFLLERVLLSVVVAGFSGVDASIIYLSCKKGESQRAFGIYSACGMAGLMFAAAVFTLAIGDDYRLAGLLTVVSYALAAALAFLLVEVDRREEPPERSQPILGMLRGALGSWHLLLFLVGVALLTETHQTITVFLNQLQFARTGMDGSVMGLAYMVATVLGLCGVFSHALTRRLGERASMVMFGLVPAVSCVVLAASSLPLISVAGIWTIRLSNALFQPLQMEMQNRMVEGSARATALSVNAMVMDCLAIALNLVFGALAESGVGLALAFGGVVCVLGVALLLLWSRFAPSAVAPLE
ncbi:MAG: MFS transporter [Collinsella sp.]|nr:MFS transporter [Collinsella sp.]